MAKKLTPYEKRRKTLLDKYGGEDGLKEHYRSMQQKSMEAPTKQRGIYQGPFNDREFARQAGRKGGLARRHREDKGNLDT